MRTYLASGNLVFEAAGGPAVGVLVIGAAEWRRILTGCPFAPAAGKLVHGFVCWQTPVLDHALLARLALPGDVVELRGRVVWLCARWRGAVKTGGANGGGAGRRAGDRAQPQHAEGAGGNAGRGAAGLLRDGPMKSRCILICCIIPC